MPEISRFFGIVIRMFYLDHEPPHLHATYGGVEVRVRIDPVSLLDGSLPPRALALLLEWVSLHQDELRENWRRLRAAQKPLSIAPLE